MNLRFITHLDTLAVNAQFCRLVSADPWGGKTSLATMTDPNMPHKTLFLRVQNNPTRENWLDDVPMHDEPEFEKWKSLRALLGRARKAIYADPVLREMVDPEAQPGRIVISVLKPNNVMAWHSDLGDYAKRHLRFHLALQTNPACYLYGRHEQLHLPVGGLAYLNALDPHCAANWGSSLRSHLVFELRRRDAPEPGA